MPSSPQPSFPTDLSPADRLMWRIERDPVLRSSIVAVALLDREPSAAAVQATFARAVERVPRLHQRIVASGIGGRRLRWEDDPAFSLDFHLRRARAPEPGDVRAVLDMTAPWATAALDPARPQWECTLVEGLDGGRAALVLKFHHTITDGVGGVDLAGSVFDTSPRGARAPARVETGAAEDVRPTGRGVPGAELVSWAAGAVRAAGTAASRPRATAGATLRLLTSIRRMLEPAPAPLSPVLLGRGLDRHLDVLELPLLEVRACAHRLGQTINSVFLAGLAGALHDYHDRLGHEVPAVRVTMPINLRKEGDPPGGNQFTPARFVLPIDDPDPAVRASIAGAIARRWRDEPAVGLTDVLALALDQLPASVVTPVFGSMLRNIDVDAVDVPGLQRDAFVGGARIERMWAFAPPTGAALSITLLSHLDTACIGVLSDVAAVSDPALLRTCLVHSFEQVLASGLDAARPTVVAS
jgi:WS/DGAT/MGAT family acyltransferase